MIKYKVLDEDLRSPFRRMEDKIGEEYVCDDFDPDLTIECSRGFYATDLDGIFCSYRPGKLIFECEVGGNQVIFDQFKQRFEKIKLIKEIPIDEIKNRMSKLNYDWNILEATFPINPFEIDYKFNESHIELVRKWASVEGFVLDSVLDSAEGSVGGSVWLTVWYSVRNTVRDPILDSIFGFVRNTVRNSIEGCIWAYMSSLFPNIKKWKYIDHPKGKNPFQPAIDLWKLGAVISHDGEIYRIHSKNGVEWIGGIEWEGKI